jgi:uncharacterized protein YfbU (UPF0304 family)
MATVSFRVSDELKRELDELSAEKGINLSKLFRLALEKIKDELLFGSYERATLQLSLKDRLFLSNQYRILECLDPGAVAHHRHNREIVEKGYEVRYPALAETFRAGIDIDLCREALDILDMFALLGLSYDAAGAPAGVDRLALRFDGFNADFEEELLAYVRYFILKLDRYPSLRASDDDNFAARAPMLEVYRRMLAVWDEIGRGRLMTSAEIARIAEARTARHEHSRSGAALSAD